MAKNAKKEASGKVEDRKIVAVKETTPIMIPIEKILVDESYNVRKVYDDSEADRLTGDIKMRGQMTPVMVVPNHDNSDKPYKLIVGFRRMRSLVKLGAKLVKAEVYDGDAFSAKAANVAENVVRSNLLPYELAMELVAMREQYRVSGEKLGRLVGVSKQYANHLMHVEDSLCPEILNVFHQPQSPGITALLRYAPLTHDEQRALWDKEHGTESHKGKDGGAPPKSDDDDEASGKLLRPSTTEIDLALAALLAKVSEGKITKEESKFAERALKWCGGVTKSILGVYDPAVEADKRARQKEIEKKAREAERAKAKEDKEIEKLAKEQERAAEQATKQEEKATKAAEAAKAAEEKAKIAKAKAAEEAKRANSAS